MEPRHERLRYLFFALQLFAEQLLLQAVQASLQTFHLLLQCLGGRRKTHCHQESDGGKKGKSLCLCGVVCKQRTRIYTNLQLRLR